MVVSNPAALTTEGPCSLDYLSPVLWSIPVIWKHCTGGMFTRTAELRARGYQSSPVMITLGRPKSFTPTTKEGPKE